MPSRSNRNAPTVRLLCLPGAGAAAGKFERLRATFAPRLDVRTFELPGRGVRFAEPSFHRWDQHVDHFVDRIQSEPVGDWILLGESLGALTAVATANALADSFRANVLGVIVVASSPVATASRPAEEVVALLAKEAGRANLSTLSTEPSSAITDDLAAARRSVAPLRIEPLNEPLATIHGVDDGLIDADGARAWARFTRSHWTYREVPGSHFQFRQPSTCLIEAIEHSVEIIRRSAMALPAQPGPANQPNRPLGQFDKETMFP